MAFEQRLPAVDGDDGQWGDVLNQYLLKEHYNTGVNNIANGCHKTISIRPGTAAAGSAPIKLTSGPLMTTPEAGAIEYVSNQFYIRGTDGLSVSGNIGIGTAPSGAKLHIQDSAAKLKIKDSDSPSLTLGLASEVGGQLINYGSNYNQLGDRNSAYPGGFFRIELRDSLPAEFFNVKFIPAGGTETTVYQVSRTGDMVTAGNLTVSGTGNSSIAGNLATNNTLSGYTTTVTTTGTKTLTASSTFQQYFTGITTQIVQMPVVSSLVLGQQWQIVNTSTGSVTVHSSGSNEICVVSCGASVIISCISLSGTDASSWTPIWQTKVLHTPTAVWGDSVLSSSVLPGTVSYVRVPYSGSIISWFIIASAPCTATMDIWKAAGLLPTVISSITASAKPSVSADTTATSATLTGWDTSVTAGDVFGFRLDTLAGSPSSITLVLNIG